MVMRIWECLEGSGRVREGLGGSSMVRRIWERLQGSGRGQGGSGRIWGGVQNG